MTDELKQWEYDKGYEHGKADALKVIEDIKAEIQDEKEFAYEDFEQYKVDCLGVNAKYVDDELPFDEFIYGMERCLEIINKHCGNKTDQ